jgi:superfamily II DNA helicase RecQ
LSCFVKWRDGDGSVSSSAREPEPQRAETRVRRAGTRPAKSRRTEVTAVVKSTRPVEPREPEPQLSAAQAELYGTLRAWRRTKSESLGVPAFRVLSNRQLTAIARERPRDTEAFARLPGIGALRAENYGAEVLAMVAAVGRKSVAGIDAAGVT